MPVTEKAGDRIGRYKLLQQIDEGGCGVVYMAEQEEPVRRRVALKVIKLGMDTKSVIARFEAERQALALMDHPNIAKVLDAGATDTGRPYFVMELVRGIRMTEYCDQNNLSTEARLDLFIQVCKAIQHAHLKIDESNADDIGVIIGTAVGGLSSWFDCVETYLTQGPRRMNPFTMTMIIADSAPAQVAIINGARGPNMALATACATGTNSLGEAAEIIRRGSADVMLAGGSEAGIVPVASDGDRGQHGERPQHVATPRPRGRLRLVGGDLAGAHGAFARGKPSSCQTSRRVCKRILSAGWQPAPH